jgi:hypothetical protein
MKMNIEMDEAVKKKVCTLKQMLGEMDEEGKKLYLQIYKWKFLSAIMSTVSQEKFLNLKKV